MGGGVARMGEKRKSNRILVEKPKDRDHSEDVGVNGKKII
jgi:hypothetical protein